MTPGTKFREQRRGKALRPCGDALSAHAPCECVRAVTEGQDSRFFFGEMSEGFILGNFSHILRDKL